MGAPIVTVGRVASFDTVLVERAPSFPAASVNVTDNVNVPSFRPLTFIPEIFLFATFTVPEPVTAVPPPELDIE